MDRRTFIGALASGLLAAPLTAEGQQSTKLYRIGVLIGASEAFVGPYLEIFRQALRDLGYVEGRNITIELRYADGHYDRLRALAADLVRLKVDVVVTEGTPPTRAATQATRTIPIVMTVTGDPVEAGLVTNLARPGGNLTGASFFIVELGAKRLQLLKEAIPTLSRVAVVWNPRNAVHGSVVKRIETTAKTLGIDAVQHIKIQAPADVGDALARIGQGRSGLVVLEDAMINVCSSQIADVAVKHRLPTIFGLPTFAEAGGLMAYGPNRRELWRRAAIFVDKILKGARPGDLPVEQPTKFELVINLKTAKALGLTIPPSLLQRADQVIE
ncbi:MAG TPA: ABC transporter substrate-binding protein [Gemmatimonadales bacterium]|nr:ABC transporter substrate-binding protein [Gemmatimonadales bacterium]